GSTVPSSAQSIGYGGTTEFTFSPSAGSTLSSVGGTCGGTLVGGIFTTARITSSCTVVANFTTSGTTLTITPIVETGGIVSSTGGTMTQNAPTTVYSGGVASFTLAPSSGYNSNSVTGTCGGTLV